MCAGQTLNLTTWFVAEFAYELERAGMVFASFWGCRFRVWIAQEGAE